VNCHTMTPVNAVWFNTTIGVLTTLLIFGGTIAIGAIFSIAAVASFTAFTIPIFIKIFFAGNRFRPGPWNLGKFSTAIGVMACTFVLLMVPILCFPAVTGADLNPSAMNWTALVYGVPMLGAMIWWFVDAHKWFKGPKVNIEHRMLGHEGNVIEGEAEGGENGGNNTPEAEAKQAYPHQSDGSSSESLKQAQDFKAAGLA